MEDYHQMTLAEWVDLKEQFRRELNNVRIAYIRVGYVLRRMDETKAYEAEGYKSVAEFAEKERELKETVSELEAVRVSHRELMMRMEDLIAKYENPIQHTCDVREGQTWISEDGQRPEGMCPSAWDSMKPFVESLAKGEGNFFDGWMKNPMSAMISCNDGFRPFTFYLEVV